MRANDMQQAIYISDIAVAKRYQVSRATIWRWAQSKRFPDPVKLSAGCTRWRLADIEKWEIDQPAVRTAK
jgi:predicted DNA-binding transcriptional regulator AlpA